MGLASKLAASKQQSQPAQYASSDGNYPPQEAYNSNAGNGKTNLPPSLVPGGGTTQYAPPTTPHPSTQQQQSNPSQSNNQQYQPQYQQNQGYPQQQQQEPPQQQQYQAQPPQQQQQQQNYAAPPPYVSQQSRPQTQQQPQQHHQQGGNTADKDPQAILSILRQAVQDQNIGAFYPAGSLEQLAQVVAHSGAIAKIAHEWSIPLELGMDLCKLSLFDTVLFVDDSGSMQFEEGGSRIDDLKLIISRVAYASSLFDQDGIQVRFMNSKLEGNNITSESEALGLVSQVRFSGLTPLGTELDNKVLKPLVLAKAKRNALEKPVLIIVVTDGVPGGEDHHKIVKVILNANKELSKTRYGSDAISFQLAQVGNDLKARAFLEELDSHREIGGLIDTTSNYENEADDMAKANPPVELTPELWLVKLLMGGIDSSYDSKDE